MAAVDIPKQHKAVVYDKPGEVSTKVTEVETPEPGAGQVLIHLTHSGVCHSDYGVMTNSWRILPHPTQPGQVGGHEGVGKVVKLGPGTESSGVNVGDRVGVKWISYTCQNCEACLTGRDGLCFKAQISGYYTPGTFQQYVLGPANYVTPIPENLDSAAAAPMLCGGITVYAALRKTGKKAGDWVAIMGAGGGLGHLACQIAARGMGFRVVGIDHSSKKQLALDSGAEVFFGIDEISDIPDEVKKATGGLGVHAVVVVTASNKAYGQAMDLIRLGGTIVCVGIPEGDFQAIDGVFPGMMVVKEATVTGSAVGTRQDAIECLDMASRGIVKMHFKTEPMDRLSEVFKQMDEGKLQGRVVLDLQ